MIFVSAVVALMELTILMSKILLSYGVVKNIDHPINR